MGNGKLYLLNARHAALCIVHGVGFPLIGQPVYCVQFFLCQADCWRVLYQHLVPVPLEHSLSGDLVLLVVLLAGGLGVCLFVAADLCIIRTLHAAPRGVFRRGEITGAANVRDLLYGHALCQQLCQFGDLVFPHAVHQQICSAVCQNGRADSVVPVVIVGEPPQRSFQSANGNGSIGVSLPNFPAVGDDGTVGTKPGPAAGGVHVSAAFPLGGSVVGNHGIDVAAGHQKCQSGLAKSGEVFHRVPVRLGENGDAVALRL